MAYVRRELFCLVTIALRPGWLIKQMMIMIRHGKCI